MSIINVCISMLPQEISVPFVTILSQTPSVWSFSFSPIEVILILLQCNFDVKMHVKRDIVLFWTCSVFMHLFIPVCLFNPLCFPNTTAFSQSQLLQLISVYQESRQWVGKRCVTFAFITQMPQSGATTLGCNQLIQNDFSLMYLTLAGPKLDHWIIWRKFNVTF